MSLKNIFLEREVEFVHLCVCSVASICRLHCQVVKGSLLSIQRLGNDDGAHRLLHIEHTAAVPICSRERRSDRRKVQKLSLFRRPSVIMPSMRVQYVDIHGIHTPVVLSHVLESDYSCPNMHSSKFDVLHSPTNPKGMRS